LVIVICPSCGTRYKLPDGIALAGKRMRCAECEHRWMIDTETGLTEDDELARAQEALRTAQTPQPETQAQPLPAPDVAPDAEETPPEPEADVEEEDAPPRRWLGWAIAIVAAAALGLLAASLWLERFDPSRVPVIGSTLAGLGPGPSPIVLSAQGRLSSLATGGLLLDISGEVRNSSTRAHALTPLKATLSVPSGAGRGWCIAAPAAQIAPGASLSFTSTLTDVPADATKLRISSGG
jgi:predicted Zn finger-like uncharacterized protein